MAQQNIELLGKTNIHKAFLTLVLPTILSQLIAVIYNMSDSFWIGQLNDPTQFAAAFICVPTFLFLVGVSNIFGVGGASLIARSLGKKEFRKAKSVCAFCLWTTLICSGLYGLIFYLLRQPLLHFVGATNETYLYCEQYAFWTVVIGAIPAALTGLFGHLIRSEGYAKQASFGMVLGLGLNVVLDPIFIFWLHLGIVGAAVATTISMCIGCLYFIYFFMTHKDTGVLTLNPRYYRARNHIAPEVMLVGLPSTLVTMMSIISTIILNNLTANYSSAAVAGMGVAKRIDLIVFAVTNGIGQGALPLISYNYAAQNLKRLKASIKITFTYGFTLSFVFMFFLFFGAKWITNFFIQDPETIYYGGHFLKVISLTCPFFALALIILTIFQAIGKRVQPIILSLIRKGGIDIPMMLVLNKTIGLMGVAWAFPIEDILSAFIACFLFRPVWKKWRLKKAGQKK